MRSEPHWRTSPYNVRRAGISLQTSGFEKVACQLRANYPLRGAAGGSSGSPPSLRNRDNVGPGRRCRGLGQEARPGGGDEGLAGLFRVGVVVDGEVEPTAVLM